MACGVRLLALSASAPLVACTAACLDTVGWTNGQQAGCREYMKEGWCKDGVVNEVWTTGGNFAHPEDNCCVCGGGMDGAILKVEGFGAQEGLTNPIQEHNLAEVGPKQKCGQIVFIRIQKTGSTTFGEQVLPKMAHLYGQQYNSWSHLDFGGFRALARHYEKLAESDTTIGPTCAVTWLRRNPVECFLSEFTMLDELAHIGIHALGTLVFVSAHAQPA